jgi:hypothetical protein
MLVWQQTVQAIKSKEEQETDIIFPDVFNSSMQWLSLLIMQT